MIDNLKDAIAHAKEVAIYQRRVADTWDDLSDRVKMNVPPDYQICLECAKEHELLAEWLTELAERREADKWIPVSERLPKPQKPNDDIYNTHCSDFVLVCIEWWNGQKVIETASYNFDDEEWEYYGSEEAEIVAWRSLPKPYESEDT